MVDIAVLAYHRVKVEESEKIDKYIELARRVKNYGTWRWRWYQL